jgi:solute carrier family 30 (zinc transporter), member 9
VSSSPDPAAGAPKDSKTEDKDLQGAIAAAANALDSKYESGSSPEPSSPNARSAANTEGSLAGAKARESKEYTTQTAHSSDPSNSWDASSSTSTASTASSATTNNNTSNSNNNNSHTYNTYTNPANMTTASSKQAAATAAAAAAAAAAASASGFQPDHAMLPESTGRVLAMSLMGNLVIASTKFYVYTVTGHSAMFTEAVHTFVDVCNQAILQIGLRQVQRSPDSTHQYGYGRAAFFFSLISALSTFGVGAGYTFYEAVHNILHPQEAVGLEYKWTWGVLGISLLVDGVVLRRAWADASTRAKAMNLSTQKWLFAFKDPFTVSVVFEDSAAVIGVGLAGMGIALTQLTGNPIWDHLASLSISALLAAVSLKLVKMNHDFILGRPVDQSTIDSIKRDILLKRPSIDQVFAVQSQWLGATAFSYKAEVDFDGTYIAALLFHQYQKELLAAAARGTLKEDLGWLLPCYAEDVIRELEKEVRAIQREVRNHHPEASFVEIVPDSSQHKTLALADMGAIARKVEWAQLKALMQKGDHSEQYTLGSIYLSQRQYNKALSPLAACLEQRRALFGSDHPDVATVLEKLGLVHYHVGNLAKAESYAMDAIAVFLRNPGKSTSDGRSVESDLAGAFEILGHVERDRGHLLRALDHFRMSLQLREQSKDVSESLVQHSLELIATVHTMLPVKRDEGIAAFRRLLSIRERTIGGDHFSNGDLFMRMADLLYKDGQQTQAVETMMRALRIIERHTGRDSLQTAALLRNMGTVLVDMQQPKKALPYLQRALAIRETHLDPRHPEVLAIIEQLAVLYIKLGEPLPHKWQWPS